MMRVDCERFSGSSSSVRWWTRFCSSSTAPWEGLSRVSPPCLSVWRGWPACCWMGCTARQFTALNSSARTQTCWLFYVSFRSQTIALVLSGRNFNLEEALEGVSSQISCEINKSLTERSYPALTPALQATLKGQICSITQKDNPIRTLVGKGWWSGGTPYFI